jgi:hypothetical protein
MVLVLTSRCIQGQEFAINVIDKLTETSLDLATSIVRSPLYSSCRVSRELDAFFCSIGTVSFNTTRIMSTVLPSLPNVL